MSGNAPPVKTDAPPAPSPEPAPAPSPTPAPSPAPAPAEKPPAEPEPTIIGGEAEKKEPAPGEKKEGGEAVKKNEPPAAIKYEAFKLPEGVELEPEALAAATKFMSEELKLPQAEAQKLVDFHVDALRKEAEAPYQLWADTQKQWQAEVKADPVIGGDNLPVVKTRISKLLDEFGDPKVREALVFTGAGNNPAIIRTLAKIADRLVEAPFVPGGGAPPAPKDAASVFYPSMKGT